MTILSTTYRPYPNASTFGRSSKPEYPTQSTPTFGMALIKDQERLRKLLVYHNHMSLLRTVRSKRYEGIEPTVAAILEASQSAIIDITNIIKKDRYLLTDEQLSAMGAEIAKQFNGALSKSEAEYQAALQMLEAVETQTGKRKKINPLLTAPLFEAIAKHYDLKRQ